MPSYELSLIARPLLKAEMIPVVKRMGVTILNSGGVLRKIESLGNRELPWKFTAHNETFEKGGYFVLHFDSSSKFITTLLAKCKVDVDIIRAKCHPKTEESPFKCTLEDELKPPPERPSVAAIFEKKKKPNPLSTDTSFTIPLVR